jgi:hypothetical protein
LDRRVNNLVSRLAHVREQQEPSAMGDAAMNPEFLKGWRKNVFWLGLIAAVILLAWTILSEK